MYVKMSQQMIDIKKASQIAKKFFKTDKCYGSIGEIRESEQDWMFEGKAKKTLYGASIVCVPKNGEDPYLMNASDPEQIWERAIKL